MAMYCYLTDDIYCEDKSNTCIQFCCPYGQYENEKGCSVYQGGSNESNWKPDVLDIAEANGSGRAIYGKYPKYICGNGSLIVDSTTEVMPLNILKNGNLDWGITFFLLKIIYFYYNNEFRG